MNFYPDIDFISMLLSIILIIPNYELIPLKLYWESRYLFLKGSLWFIKERASFFLITNVVHHYGYDPQV